MDIGSAGLSDTSILDSSIDSVDSVVQKQIECNKLLIKMATSLTDTPTVTGRKKLPWDLQNKISEHTSHRSNAKCLLGRFD
jgi:hypothetical protein